MPRTDPGPVADQIERALLGGRERSRRLPEPGSQFGVQSDRHAHTGERGLRRRIGGGRGERERLAEREAARSAGTAPDRRVSVAQGDVMFQGQEADRGRTRDEPPGVAQARLVRADQQDRANALSRPEPAHALAERGPVCRAALAHNRDPAAIGQREHGVERACPMPTQDEWEGELGRRGGEPVDDGDRVQALEDDPPPLFRDGRSAQQLEQGLAALGGQAPQASGREAEPAGRRNQIRGMSDRLHEFPLQQAIDPLIDGGR